MREAFTVWAPRGDTAAVVDQADSICREYRRQGYDLTLRQLYYQFVARGLIPDAPGRDRRPLRGVDVARPLTPRRRPAVRSSRRRAALARVRREYRRRVRRGARFLEMMKRRYGQEIGAMYAIKARLQWLHGTPLQ